MLYFVTPAPNVFPGVTRLFREAIEVVGGEHLYLNGITGVNRDDTVVFGAWHPQYSTAIRRCKAKKKIIEFSSPFLQQDLSGIESEYLLTILQLLDKEVIDGIWFVDKNNYEIFKDKEGVFYTPHPFSVEKLKKYRMKDKDKEGVNLFTVFHPRKNVMVQLSAAKLAQEENGFMLFTNGMPPTYQQFANSIGLNFYDWGFLPQADYFSWLSSSRLSLNVFLSEAFAYTCAEALSLGVPVLMSHVVAKNMGCVNEGKLVVKDISSAEEISSRIAAILQSDGKSYTKLCEKCVSAIKQTSQKNNAVVKETFLNIQN